MISTKSLFSILLTNQEPRNGSRLGPRDVLFEAPFQCMMASQVPSTSNLSSQVCREAAWELRYRGKNDRKGRAKVSLSTLR